MNPRTNVRMGANSFWRASARVFRDRKAVVVSGMLLALHLVLSVFISLPLTPSVRISIAFITNVVTGYLYGPWMAMVTGALGDILQLILKPTGSYFFGWTFNAALGGFLYGLMFYKRAPKEKKRREETEKTAEWSAARFRAEEVLSVGIFILILAAGAFLPFLRVVAKDAGQTVLSSGSAFSYLAGTAGEAADGSPKTLAVAVFVMAAAGIVFHLCRRRILSVVLSAAACLWLLLPVYTNRAVLKADIGFYCIAACFFISIILNLVFVLRQKSMDAGFLLRCFITMLIVAVVVQMFLGTVWCVIMYGNGFWFYFAQRAAKSLIQLPFNTVLAYYVIRMMKQRQAEFLGYI